MEGSPHFLGAATEHTAPSSYVRPVGRGKSSRTRSGVPASVMPGCYRGQVSDRCPKSVRIRSRAARSRKLRGTPPSDRLSIRSRSTMAPASSQSTSARANSPAGEAPTRAVMRYPPGERATACSQNRETQGRNLGAGARPLCQKRATALPFPPFCRFLPIVESATYVFSKAAKGSTPSVRTTRRDLLFPARLQAGPGLALFSFTPGAGGCILMSGWALIPRFFVVLSGCSALRID